MGRLNDLYQVWSWLPHFRAIAETEHLGAAGALLRVSPPAMSRALQQLENALGTKLFERRGRTLVLNDAGTELLSAVRTAMRGIDDSLGAISTARQLVHVKVSAPGPYYRSLVMPAYTGARVAWPTLQVELVESPANIPAALARGDVDVCVHEHEVTGTAITVEAISHVQKLVACARSHPAARRRRLSVEDLAAFEFVAPPADANGTRRDGWPPMVSRRVGLTVANMQLGVEAAASGAYLAVLPLPVVASADLVALPVQGLTIPLTTIFASRRRATGDKSDVFARFVELLRAELDERQRARGRTNVARK